MANQSAVKCTIMRGGTSKGVFFKEEDVPVEPTLRDRLILSVMGSPDPRQINGLGGADLLTSKIVIVGDGSAHGADVMYTFGQVGIEQSYVSYSANCGNLTSAVGVYAIEEGLVKAIEPVTTVRLYNANTNTVLVSHVPVTSGRPAVTGDYAIDGVPGTGAEIRVDFSRTAGATTGRMLPTGRVRDNLYIPEFGRSIPVSFVDVAKVSMFVHARELGLRGNEGPEDFTSDVLARYWAVHQAGAKLLGIAPQLRLPMPVSVAESSGYIDYMIKRPVSAGAISFVARRVGGPPARLHKAFDGTGAIGTAVAAALSGTVVHEVAHDFGDGIVRIGHPTGVFPVRVKLGSDGGLMEVSYSRTARRIMDGLAYVPHSALSL